MNDQFWVEGQDELESNRANSSWESDRFLGARRSLLTQQPSRTL